MIYRLTVIAFSSSTRNHILGISAIKQSPMSQFNMVALLSVTPIL